jgi:hypothetical protein
MNDLIFRRRLFNTVWRSRKKALGQMRSFLVSGKNFDFSMDAESSSLRRDFLLLFTVDSMVHTRLEEECRYLPQNQRPSNHERYALIVDMCRMKTWNPMVDTDSSLDGSSSNFLDRSIQENMDAIYRNTPMVEDNWFVYSIMNGDKRLGRKFVAPSMELAEKFLSEVIKALEYQTTGQDLPPTLLGMRPLMFLDTDPDIFSDRSAKQEEELITDIFNTMKNSSQSVDEPITHLNQEIGDLKRLFEIEK